MKYYLIRKLPRNSDSESMALDLVCGVLGTRITKACSPKKHGKMSDRFGDCFHYSRIQVKKKKNRIRLFLSECLAEGTQLYSVVNYFISMLGIIRNSEISS